METLRNPLEGSAQLQALLAQAGIKSMVVGGLAVAVWGEPRATRDADLKVLLERRDSPRLLACLPADKYEVPINALDILERLGFLFIRCAGGLRIDLLLAETAFDAQAVARSRLVLALPSLNLVVCAPEDLIVYKMISTRPRDQADVPGILLRQRDSLDHQYVERWLMEFEKALDDSTLINSYRRLREAVS
jgi:hypothetical protein